MSITLFTKFKWHHIVMLTMHADQEVLTNAIRAGAIGYLTKDCSTREIAEAA